MGGGGVAVAWGGGSVDVFSFACCRWCYCRLCCCIIRIMVVLLVVVIDESESQCLIDLAFEFGGRSTGAGAEVYECVVFD